MMRGCVFALVLAEFSGLCAAQGLGEAAASERRRREALRQSGRAATTTFSDRPVAQDWRRFAAPDGEFSVLLPTAPEVLLDELRHGATLVPRRSFHSASGDVEYVVQVADYPSALVASPQAVEALFDAVRLEQSLRYQSSVREQAVIGLQGALGRQFSLSCAEEASSFSEERGAPEPQPESEPEGLQQPCPTHLARAYLARERLFVLTVRGRGQPDERFFESFRMGPVPGTS